jgi:hypothetical protein
VRAARHGSSEPGLDGLPYGQEDRSRNDRDDTGVSDAWATSGSASHQAKQGSTISSRKVPRAGQVVKMVAVPGGVCGEPSGGD